MDKEYVPYEQSLELEQLGFDEYCMEACYYEWKDKGVTHILLHTPDEYDPHDGVKAPLYQQAFRWFRDNYKMTAEVSVSQYRRTDIDKWMYSITYLERMTYSYSETTYNTYEEAELACVIKLIDIVKKQNLKV
jgi:hypothetical protein